jgi:hypothetical protein
MRCTIAPFDLCLRLTDLGSEYSGNEMLSDKAPGGEDLLLPVDPRSAKLHHGYYRNLTRYDF